MLRFYFATLEVILPVSLIFANVKRAIFWRMRRNFHFGSVKRSHRGGCHSCSFESPFCVWFVFEKTEKNRNATFGQTRLSFLLLSSTTNNVHRSRISFSMTYSVHASRISFGLGTHRRVYTDGSNITF